jgi:hypothetical protein
MLQGVRALIAHGILFWIEPLPAQGGRVFAFGARISGRFVLYDSPRARTSA